MNELADAGLDEIHISIDTINAERYFEVKKGDYADRVTENIEACIPVIEARRDVQIFIKYFTKETSNAYGMTEEDSVEVRARFVEQAMHSEYVHLKEMPLVDVGLGMLENKDDYLTPCEIPFYLLYIMHDGKVSACCSDVFNGMTVGRLTPPAIPTPKPAAVTSLLDVVDAKSSTICARNISTGAATRSSCAPDAAIARRSICRSSRRKPSLTSMSGSCRACRRPPSRAHTRTEKGPVQRSCAGPFLMWCTMRSECASGTRPARP